jgi:hypothetical protein
MQALDERGASLSMRASAWLPMRVMMRMLATTYGLSVISTPHAR